MSEPILDAFSVILRQLLDDDSIVLTASTTRADVSGWDSFAYITFLAAVEQQFGVKFGVAEVEGFRTVGEIATAVEDRRGRT
jgi:acyl carrier protein